MTRKPDYLFSPGRTETIEKALKPLQDVTDAFSGEEYVVLSYVRPVLHQFNNSLLAPEEILGDNRLCKSIKSCIVEYLNWKYADPSTSDLLDIASLLDPRFKARYISSEKLVITEAQSLCPVTRQQRQCHPQLKKKKTEISGAYLLPQALRTHRRTQ